MKHGFFAGGGEMGALMRAYDWENSALGSPEAWPQSLRTAVRLMLTTRHPMFIWWGPDLIQFYNDAYRKTMGPERHPSALGQRGRECWQEIWDIIGPQIEMVMRGEGSTWHEDQLVPVTRHGRREDVWWTYSYGPIDDENAPSGVGGVLVVCNDVTDRRLLINELQHRGKNMLATVHAIAQQTLRPGRSLAEAREALTARLMALARAQDILGQGPFAAAMHSLVETAIAPYAGEESPFDVDGPPLHVQPRAAMSFALMLHELATNAAKYGALSAPAGRVDVSWRIDGDRIRFVWAERGGPPVTPPKRKGFGSRLIDGTMGSELGAEVDARFEPTGVVWSLSVPVVVLQEREQVS